jgi:prepilin-type processing-associated H-X9-DG protein
VEGETLSERIEVAGVEIPKYNLESFWTPWQDVEKITLTHQQDYDLIVLGIPLGSLPYICPELLVVEGKAGDKWRNMVKYVKTNQTQALQLWLSDTYAELGWPFQGMGRPLVGEFDTKPEYVDTWADMSQVIKRENWPAGFEPQDIAYFIGVLKDDFGPTLPPASDHNFPHQQFQRTKENSLGFLRENIQDLWPEATKPDGPYPHALDWQILIDENEGQQGEQRLNSQFWRANIDPSERYVLSVVGSTQYRLKTDESGYDNLFLTGDWIYNGANVGFVDGAVTSGMRTSQAITKLLLGQTYPPKIFGWEDY